MLSSSSPHFFTIFLPWISCYHLPHGWKLTPNLFSFPLKLAVGAWKHASGFDPRSFLGRLCDFIVFGNLRFGWKYKNLSTDNTARMGSRFVGPWQRWKNFSIRGFSTIDSFNAPMTCLIVLPVSLELLQSSRCVLAVVHMVFKAIFNPTDAHTGIAQCWTLNFDVIKILSPITLRFSGSQLTVLARSIRSNELSVSSVFPAPNILVTVWVNYPRSKSGMKEVLQRPVDWVSMELNYKVKGGHGQRYKLSRVGGFPINRLGVLTEKRIKERKN